MKSDPLSGKHFKMQCEHGLILAQCRCPSLDKRVVVVPCSEITDHDRLLRETGAL